MINTNFDRTKELFANIGKIITSSLELNEILDGVMKEVESYFFPKNWSLMRYDEASECLYFTIVQGISYKEVEHVRLKRGEGIAGAVVDSGESIFVPDASRDPRFCDSVDKITGYSTRSIIAVPIKSRGKTYGVIEIINRDNGANFSEDEHLILNTIADFTAIAFSNHIVHKCAVSMGETDHLTGCFNKAKLDKVIKDFTHKKYQHVINTEEWEQLVVVFIDLNNFKEMNDSFGHREGDEVLKIVTGILRDIFRRDDLIFRVGGDEFLAIINFKTDRERDMIIRRAESALSAFSYTDKEKGYSIKLSYGIKVGPAEKINDLINESDMAMYDHKRKR
jgi:diguanylate cyclase (GGDEF)-like protein